MNLMISTLAASAAVVLHGCSESYQEDSFLGLKCDPNEELYTCGDGVHCVQDEFGLHYCTIACGGEDEDFCKGGTQIGRAAEGRAGFKCQDDSNYCSIDLYSTGLLDTTVPHTITFYKFTIVILPTITIIQLGDSCDVDLPSGDEIPCHPHWVDALGKKAEFQCINNECTIPCHQGDDNECNRFKRDAGDVRWMCGDSGFCERTDEQTPDAQNNNKGTKTLPKTKVLPPKGAKHQDRTSHYTYSMQHM